MKICILSIATNKYIKYVQNLYDNINEYFLNGHDISFLLFTNHSVEASDDVKVHQIEHEPWPIPTLKRYHYFIEERSYIETFDYCFYLDVDMSIVKPVGDEVLGDLVATRHPGQSFLGVYNCSYERNPSSTAYIPIGEGNNYYAGGFNGGRTKEFIKMAETISRNVDTDFKNNIIARWHDESHMNRYLVDHPATVELGPEYCYPEAALKNPAGWEISKHCNPIILALDKDHDQIRT